MAVLRNWSAAGVNRELLMRPMRVKVRRATGSHNSAETPAANIAIARCSSESRSVHEMSSIAYLRLKLPRDDGTREVKVLLKGHLARRMIWLRVSLTQQGRRSPPRARHQLTCGQDRGLRIGHGRFVWSSC